MNVKMVNEQAGRNGVHLQWVGLPPVFVKAGGGCVSSSQEGRNVVFDTQPSDNPTYLEVTTPFLHPVLLSPVFPMPATPSTPLASGVPGTPADSGPLHAWLEWLGLRFDPFGPLDAASDPRLGEYLVGHEAFVRVWGDWPSWVFAPPGGGKTALRVRTAQACWVGQDTNRPFPVSYIPPFLSWGHTSPSLDDHLAALARAGAVALLLALAHRPHWLFRLDDEACRTVREALDWNLPGPLSDYLARWRQSGSLHSLRDSLDPTFLLPDPPDGDTLLRWCDALDAVPGGDSRPAPAARWDSLCDLLLGALEFRSIYLLIDGLDAAPETIADAQAMVDCLAPLDAVGRRLEQATNIRQRILAAGVADSPGRSVYPSFRQRSHRYGALDGSAPGRGGPAAGLRRQRGGFR